MTMTTATAATSSAVLPRTASLEGVPDDVLAHVFELLGDVELVRLQQVSRVMNARVLSLGIPLHLTHHAMSHRTLSPGPPTSPRTSQSPKSSSITCNWPAPTLFAHNARITRSLATHTLHAVQLGQTWKQRAIPALQLTPDRLLLGVGGSVLVHPLHSTSSYAPKVVGEATEYSLTRGAGPRASSASDIVGIHELSGGSLAVAHFDGTLQRVELSGRGGGAKAKSTAHYAHPPGANIHVMAGCGDMLLTASTTSSRSPTPTAHAAARSPVTGSVRLWRASSPWLPAIEYALPTVRAWAAHLTPQRAFLGLSGGIHVLALRPSGPQRTAILHGMQPQHSAAYGVLTAAGASGGGGGGSFGNAADHILLSAWHDGVARLHDLRAGADPVLELSDPWSDAGLYCASWVGAHGVAAGGAQHGQVSVYDVRRPKTGWTVFTPGGRGSPVYAMAGEGGRVWGVSERRAFVLTFDGAGERAGGIVTEGARATQHPVGKAKEVPAGFRRGGRGGRMNWTVHYGDAAVREVSMGYGHGDRGMALFESKVPA